MYNRILHNHGVVSATAFLAGIVLFAPAVQGGNYSFSSFQQLNGAIVYDVAEDDLGCIWLGTETGVWRWRANGFEPVSSPTSTTAPTLVPTGWGRGAITIACDGQSTLWIGTGGGLLALNMESLDPIPVPRELESMRINRLRRMKDGEVWAGAANGLFRLKWSDGRVKAIPIPGVEATSIEAFALVGDTLWYGTANALYERTDGELKVHLDKEVKGRAMHLHAATDGSLWIGLRKDPGLYRRDPSGALRRYSVDDGLLNDEVNTITERPNGEIWVGTERGVYRLLNERFQAFGDHNGLTQADVHAIRIDGEGSIWIGTFGGGAFLLHSPDIMTFRNDDGLSNPFVSAMCESSPGNLVVGSIQGFSRLNLTTGRGEPSTRFDHVRAMARDGEGRVWLAGSTRLFCVETEFEEDIHIVADAIAFDRNDVLWIAGDKGLFQREGDTVRPVDVGADLAGAAGALFVEPDGSVVVGIGKNLVRGREGSWQSTRLESPVRAIAPARQGGFWVGTEKALRRHDSTTLSILTEYMDVRRTYCIATADDDVVWCGTESGLLRIQGDKLHRMTLADGLPSSDVRTLLVLDSSTLLAGTTDGLARIDASRWEINERPPRIRLEIWSMGQIVGRSGKAGISTSLYDQNLIAEISPIGMRNQAGMRFQHKIDGDLEWSDWTVDRRIRVRQLPAGNYVMRVRGRNAYGVESKPDSVKLEIIAPLWQTTGFLASSGVGLLMALGGGAYLVRKRTHYRQTIEHSERKYRTLVESLRVIPYQADPETGEFRYVGPQTAGILGHESRKWRAVDGSPEIVPPEDAGVIRRLWSKTRDTRDHCVAEHRLTCANGDVRWFRNLVSIGGREGESLASGLMIDITAEKRAEATEKAMRAELEAAVAARTSDLTRLNESLRKSEERFSRLFERSPVAMILTTLEDGLVLDVNEAGLHLSGFSREELVGRRITDVNAWAMAGAREKFVEVIRREGSVKGYTSQFLTKDRQLRVGRVAAELIEHDGQLCMLCAALDVTDQYRAEKEVERQGQFLRQLIDVNPHFIFTKDVEGRFTLVNKAVAEVYGTTIESLLGKTDGDFNSNSDEVAFFREIDLDVMRHQRERRVEEVITDSSGAQRHLDTIKLPLLDESGLPFGVLGISTDVTARKAAEDALRQAHAELEVRVQERTRTLAETQGFLRQVLDYSPNLIFIKDAAGSTVFTNRAVTARLGREPAAVVDEIYRGHDAPAREGWARIASGKDLVSEEREVTRNGQARWYQIVRIPLPRPDGECQVLGIVSDITERKLAEESIRESKAMLDRITDAIPGAVYKFRRTRDGAQAFEFISRGCEELFEIPAADILKNFNLAWDPILPEDAEALETSIRRSAETLTPWHQEFRIRTRSGQTKWLRGSSRTELPASPDGTTIWNGILVDVTEEKRTEQKLRDSIERFSLIAEGASDGLWDGTVTPGTEWHSPDTCVYYSPRFKMLLGYEDHEIENRLEEWSKRLHPDDVAGVMKALSDHIERKVPYEVEYRLMTKDGRYRWFQARGQAIWDEQGRVTRMAGSLNDVTRRREAEEQLRQSQKLDAVGTLASGIAHQFENLLTSITAYTDLAKTTLPKGHPAVRALNKVESTARHARGVTNALLTFSHRGTSSRTVIDLGEVAEGTMQMLSRVLSTRIAITSDIDAERPIWINADPTQFEQLLLNLAVNAQDAMPNGGRLDVSLHLTETNSEGIGHPSARLTVEDTGIGINEETLSRIFEPFFTTKPRGEGTGLGLSIILGIVRDMRGRIQVESKPGVGTKVTVEIPCCDAPVQSPAVRGPVPVRRPEEFVIVLERNPHVRSILTTTIRTLGCDVRALAIADEAIDLALKRQPWTRLLVVDCDSVSSGDLLRLAELRERIQSMKLIVLVGTLTVNLKQHRLDECLLLRKPFEMPELAELVEECLEDPGDAEKQDHE